MPPLTTADTVEIVDLFGTGTGCLVFSTPDPVKEPNCATSRYAAGYLFTSCRPSTPAADSPTPYSGDPLRNSGAKPETKHHGAQPFPQRYRS